MVLPVPLLWAYPSIQHSQEFQTYVAIAVLISILLAIRGVLWMVKPQQSVLG